MSRPIEIRAADGGYTVHYDPAAARVFGARKRALKGFPVPAAVVLKPDGSRTLAAQGPLAIVDRDLALAAAFQIGHYLLGFGTLVFTYTTYPAGFQEV